MPLYSFFNPKTKEIKDFFFGMNDKKEVFEDGVIWERQWTKPLASFDSKIDPNNPKDFVKYTEKRRGNIGEVWDLAAELSDKRGGTTGQDLVKENSYKEYSSRRNGAIHPNVKKQQSRDRLKKVGITIED